MFTEASKTPVCRLNNLGSNHLYMKREDLIPFSFGGNKARKAFLFFKEIDNGDYDCVVTYGSSSSNHCRVVANLAAQRPMPCYIISPEEAVEQTYNSRIMALLSVEIEVVPVAQVHDTIVEKMAGLRAAGHRPYFIPGGGHGSIGTQAYVDCYHEIRAYEADYQIHFDYIFFASGTGTTHAGLVCGQLLCGDERKIIGISIARKNPYGRNVVLDSIREYLGDRVDEKVIQDATVFLDAYITSGYGKHEAQVLECIKECYIHEGVHLDATYTGKAFSGMREYIAVNNVRDKNILFIHTGGTPLFFDTIKEMET